jgi:hypothetical protein
MRIRPLLVTRSLIAVLLTAVAAVATPVATPAAAPAATPTTSPLTAADAPGTPCSWWVFGRSSNCDDVDPWAGHPEDPPCANDGDDVRTATLSSDPGIRVYLYYSPRCRTVWANIIYWGSTAPGTCYVKVQRNSDNKALYAGVYKDPFVTAWVGETNMLYDADVTSYAWGHCEVGGRTYRGGTPSY